MKTLENTTTAIPTRENVGGKIEEVIGKIDYKFLIKSCLDNQPQGGFSFSDFKERDRIEKCLEDDEFAFEDEDVKNLKEIVNSMKWASRSPDLTEFLEVVNNL